MAELEEDGNIDAGIFDAGMDGNSANGSDTGYEETTPTEADAEKQERTPARLIPRTPAADFLSMVYGLVGTGLERSGKDIPVGRVLQFQAPIAGNQLDKLIANTWIDRLLQPLVSKADFMETMGSVVAFPLLIGIYERQPESALVLEPIIRQVIMTNLEAMVPVLKEKQKNERKTAKAIADLNDTFGIDKDSDPVDAVLATIFQGLTAEEAEVPTE